MDFTNDSLNNDIQTNLYLVDKTIEITSMLTNEIIKTYRTQVDTLMKEYLNLLNIVIRIMDKIGRNYEDLIKELRDTLIQSKGRIQQLNISTIEQTNTLSVENSPFIPDTNMVDSEQDEQETSMEGLPRETEETNLEDLNIDEQLEKILKI